MTDIKPDLTVTDLPSNAPDNPLEALSWLGGTIEEIAEGLRARGIKGRLWESDSCPIARYLQKWWPDASFAEGTTWIDDVRTWDAPTIVAYFADEFDDGEFPDLIAP